MVRVFIREHILKTDLGKNIKMRSYKTFVANVMIEKDEEVML